MKTGEILRGVAQWLEEDPTRLESGLCKASFRWRSAAAGARDGEQALDAVERTISPYLSTGCYMYEPGTEVEARILAAYLLAEILEDTNE